MHTRSYFLILMAYTSFGLQLPLHAAKPAAVQIIAHRGASYTAPENTLAALRLGFELANEGCELDVWVSSDGVPVVIHDVDTKRVAGVNRKVADQTSAELQKLDVGSWKAPKFAEERIPTLLEALALVPPGKRMFVEVKCDEKGIPAILQAVKEAKLKPAQTTIISFHADVVAASKKDRPDLLAYWIVSLKPNKGKEPNIADLISKAQAIGADGLNLSDSPILDAAAVKQIRAASLGLYVWTVDNPEAAKRLIDLGIDGITTNCPGWLLEQ